MRSSTKTVLVVDDNTMLLDSISAMLQMLGWLVTKASNGMEGLHALDRATYDLVILDLLMPDLNGYEVLERMREAGNESPVILSSGCGEVREEAAEAAAWLNKPFRLDDLQTAIRRALECSRK